MNSNTTFVHTRTGETVEITGTDAEMSKIVTVTTTGARIRPRAVKTNLLKTTLHNRRGAEWKAAYVAIGAFPEGHPLAPAAVVAEQENITVETSVPRFGEMTNEDLSAYANARKAEVGYASELFDMAKAALKRRYRTTGSRVVGNVYLEVSSNQRFDPKLAKSVLTAVEYNAILKPKPDPSLAREILSEKRYRQVCKDHGNKMEIRTASNDDLRAAAEREEVEKAKAVVDSMSMTPADASPFYPADADLIDSPF